MLNSKKIMILMLIAALLVGMGGLPRKTQAAPPAPLGGEYAFGAPTGLTVDEDGYLYVADTDKHAVFVIGTNGKLVRTIGTPGVSGADATHLYMPKGIAISGNGAAKRIYVLDAGNVRIQIFNGDGSYYATWSIPLPLDFGVNDIAIGNGKVYVTSQNYTIHVFDIATATYDASLSKRDAYISPLFESRRPMSITVGADGKLIVAATMPQAVGAPASTVESKIYVLNSDLTMNSSSGNLIVGVAGVQSDANGTLYTTESNGYVVRISDSAFSLGTAGVSGDDASHFMYPYSTAVDLANGILYVSDMTAKKVKVFKRSDGSYIKSYPLPPVFTVGDGSTGNPYQITNADQLNAVSDYSDKHFIVMNDIDLNVAPYNAGAGWQPIGSYDSDPLNSKPFTGTFDGNGKTISGLTIKSNKHYLGLFGYVKNANIKNVKLTEVDINVGSDAGNAGNAGAGALVGGADHSNIDNVSAKGFVISGDRTGGLLGSLTNGSTLTRASAEVALPLPRNGAFNPADYQNPPPILLDGFGNAVNYDYRGGLVGYVEGTAASPVTIKGAKATGAPHLAMDPILEGGSYLGGLVGYGRYVDIDMLSLTNEGLTYASGRVIGYNQGNPVQKFSVNVGGFAGQLEDSTVKRSYAGGGVANSGVLVTLSVEGFDKVGGFVGSSLNSSFEDVYAVSYVYGEYEAAGFAYEATNTTIDRAYAASYVNQGENEWYGFGPGGISGTEIYYDKTRVTGTDTGSGVGKLTADLKSYSTFDANNGWNVSTLWKIDADFNGGYPMFGSGAVPAPVFPSAPTAQPGTAIGSTSFTFNSHVTPAAGNHLVVKVSPSAIATPNVGDAAPAEAGVIDPYTSGNDITGVDATTNKYVGVYEVNGSGGIVRFTQIVLTSNDIKPVTPPSGLIDPTKTYEWEQLGSELPGGQAGNQGVSTYFDNGVPYVALLESVNVGGAWKRDLNVYKYVNNQWETIGNKEDLVLKEKSPGTNVIKLVEYVSLVVKDGTPYVAYAPLGGEMLAKYFDDATDEWVEAPFGTETSTNGAYMNMIVGPDRAIYLAYRESDLGNGVLRVKKYENETWSDVGNAPLEANGGYSPTLAFHDNKLRVIYSMNGGGLILATWNGTAWSKSDLESKITLFPSIVWTEQGEEIYNYIGENPPFLFGHFVSGSSTALADTGFGGSFLFATSVVRHNDELFIPLNDGTIKKSDGTSVLDGNWSDLSNVPEFADNPLGLKNGLHIDGNTLYIAYTEGNKFVLKKLVEAGGSGGAVDAVAPTITAQPSGKTARVNDTVTLSVTANASDGGTLSYQWFKSETAGGNGIAVPGATSSTYDVPTSTIGTANYFVEVTNTNDNATGTKTAKVQSANATVEVTATSSNPGPSGPSGPKKEQIMVDVATGDGEVIAKTPVERTTHPDGTVKDNVTLTPERAQETIDQLEKKANKTARIIIPDKEDKVSQTDVNVPASAVKKLADGKANLEIDTNGVRVLIPYESLEGFNEDLYFRFIPVKKEDERRQVEERAKKEEMVRAIAKTLDVSVLGRPMTIETNMQSRPVTLVMPLTGALPTNAADRQAVLDNLVIFAEHSDGTKELIRGEIITNKDGTLGVRFNVNKFSTFTMVTMKGWKEHLAALQSEEAENNGRTGTHKPYILGLPDGSFGPEKEVSRAQMATMLVRNLGAEYKGNGTLSFADVVAKHWAFKEIESANTLGLMTGYSNGSFGAEDSITRAQMAMIVDRWMKRQGKPAASDANAASFTDVSGNHWAYAAIRNAQSYGIMEGYKDHSFRPEQKLTRAEAVKVLNRLFERGPLYGVDKPTFRDVPQTYWAYNEVEEAAQEHQWAIDDKGQEMKK
ncbi:S-layer homology domain-containing protein [Cohnella herbarum]|uniref:SLH domain-containing protein n=1 Tax=Cohnella herbarum TaxID=2728023 RepID=A0A7Z2VKZ8_9BACL|nr:S-layer homology domain-containing protein [Cohnella herbarum]QJD84705.1 hypothetical protein HH215_16950 [Cohnella herbarum]